MDQEQIQQIKLKIIEKMDNESKVKHTFLKAEKGKEKEN